LIECLLSVMKMCHLHLKNDSSFWHDPTAAAAGRFLEPAP
jgi:hypothetical protein